MLCFTPFGTNDNFCTTFSAKFTFVPSSVKLSFSLFVLHSVHQENILFRCCFGFHFVFFPMMWYENGTGTRQEKKLSQICDKEKVNLQSGLLGQKRFLDTMLNSVSSLRHSEERLALNKERVVKNIYKMS